MSGPFGSLGASSDIGEHSHGAQSSFWQTVATKSKAFREPIRKGALGDLWKHSGGLWQQWGALTWTPELILADGCSEIIGFEGPGGNTRGPKVHFERPKLNLIVFLHLKNDVPKRTEDR